MIAPGWLRRRTTRAVGLGACVALLAVVVLLSLAIGAKTISPATVVRAFTDYDAASNDHLVVRGLRVPRTLVGLAIGAALGAAGALVQAVTRNPLADPGLLGVHAGATLAVVSAIAVFDVVSVSGYVWFAFVGAAVASVAVYALGSMGRGGATPVRLALAGAALTATLGAFTSCVVMLDSQSFDRMRFWAVGSITGRGTGVLVQVGPFVIAGLLLAVGLGRALNALALGDEAAHALGAGVVRTRLGVTLGVTLLAGASTAACGPIGFVGLTVPHAARACCGPDQRWIAAYSAVLGAIALLACDIAGRIVMRPGEIQVGITTAAIGGPLFVVFARRARMAAL